VDSWLAGGESHGREKTRCFLSLSLFITLGLELSDTKFYEPSIRALLGTAERCFISEQPAPAPHLAHLEGCAALRIVLVTVPRASLSREHLPRGTAPAEVGSSSGRAFVMHAVGIWAMRATAEARV
jgi:hypothetical protein